MRHTCLVVTVKKMVKIGVYIYGSYRIIKTGLSLFWTTLYYTVCQMQRVLGLNFFRRGMRISLL